MVIKIILSIICLMFALWMLYGAIIMDEQEVRAWSLITFFFLALVAYFLVN